MANLFADDFEDGTTNAWDGVVDTGSSMSVTEAAALHGTYGLNCLIDDTTAMYVRDDFTSTKIFRFRFYIDINTLTMANAKEVWIGYGNNILNTYLIRTDANGYTIRVRTTDDAGNTFIYAYGITDEPHCIEIAWSAATSDGADDGYFELWIDGVSMGSHSDINNDTKSFAYMRLGCVVVGTNISGTLFFDDYVSNVDGSEIGVISEGITWNTATITKWNTATIAKWNGQ